MIKRYLRTSIRLCLTLLCIFTLSLSAWAAENDGDASAEPSRVITCGLGESADSADTPVAERVAPEKGSTSHSSTGGKKGASLGMFTTTGYCNCEQCSGDYKLTSSGTVPKAAHTISADISIYPIGTKLMIDDVIYTVEDTGSSVRGNIIDIYYDNHDAAVAHGTKTQEVFAVIE